TLHKPRILCLHGGGVSARIFRMQARQLIEALALHFRLVFADGPFPSEMHPDLTSVYGQMGPCYRWAGWLPQHADLPAGETIETIRASLLHAMQADSAGTGRWVGLLGFSQGARLAVSILLEDQRVEKGRGKEGRFFLGVQWEFGVLLAGRGPPYNLSHQHRAAPAAEDEHEIWTTTPTLHVHGLQDPGLAFHRLLLREYAAPGSALLIEWDGEHRVPIRTVDVDAVTGGILRVAGIRGAM
ncbi:uncharacterized protein BO97DRAFT_314194, partial [Aspergillus homomorphus CBS 101889]